jgi:hypothetical protein
MKIVQATALAIALGGLVVAAPPSLAKGGSAGFGQGGTRISAGGGRSGLSGRGNMGGGEKGFRHRRDRRHDNGFGGTTNSVPDPFADSADFDVERRRGRFHDSNDGRFGRHRRSGGDVVFVEENLLGYREGWPRHNRTSLANGYFGYGSEEGNYDRGYPYDYYREGRAADPRDYRGYDARPPRGLDCRTVRVPGTADQGIVPVNICRG